jgi:hypothetical protein
MFFIEDKYGNDGYVAWFKLLELLASSENHFLDFCDPHEFAFYYKKCRLKESLAVEILNDLSVLGAIDQELWGFNGDCRGRRIVWSNNFIDSLKRLYHDRKRELPKKPNLKDLNDNMGIIPDITGIIGGKEGKGSRLDVKKGREVKTTCCRNLYFKGLILNIESKSHEAFLRAYPKISVDSVDDEYRKMDAWLVANPEKAKKNHSRFANNWLSRTAKTMPTEPATKRLPIPTMTPRPE